MKADWIKVESEKDIPDGEWLAFLEGGEIHVLSIRPISNGRLAIVGGQFSFDQKPVTHYCELPDIPEG